MYIGVVCEVDGCRFSICASMNLDEKGVSSNKQSAPATFVLFLARTAPSYWCIMTWCMPRVTPWYECGIFCVFPKSQMYSVIDLRLNFATLTAGYCRQWVSIKKCHCVYEDLASTNRSGSCVMDGVFAPIFVDVRGCVVAFEPQVCPQFQRTTRRLSKTSSTVAPSRQVVVEAQKHPTIW